MDKLTNAVSQILETDDPTADVRVVDLKTPDISLIELYKVYLQAAKDSIGITEASQGRAESSTLSGKALEALQQYTQDRMSIKQFEKNIAFTKLYRLLYEFMIAFYDDKVPFRIEGDENEPEFGVFDKGLLIKQDAAGEWYYPEFDIYIASDTGLSRDKGFIMQVADKAIQSGAADPVDFWTIMNSVGFPYAQFILDRAKERQQQAEQQAQQQAQLQQQSQQQNMDLQNKKLEMQNQQAQQKLDIQQQGMVQKQQEDAMKEMDTDAIAQAISGLSQTEQESFFQLPEQDQLSIIQGLRK
jgi:hypothetical protein